jgi:hypothetical protein
VWIEIIGRPRQVFTDAVETEAEKPQPSGDSGGITTTGPRMTLGNAAAAQVRPIVRCKSCGHQVEPEAAEMDERYAADTPVVKWREAVTLTWW